jgi:hypothetical protein
MTTDARGPRITARSFYQQLRAHGFNSQQLIGVATELIELITSSLRENRNAAEVAGSGAPHDSAESTPSRT